MSRINSSNTVAELVAFRFLRRRKIHFQKYYRLASGTPDIAQPRNKKAVFIDGDFWHGRYKKNIKRLPKIYWQDKIKKNMCRDRMVDKALIGAGWKILHVWEKDIKITKTRQKILEKISDFLS